MKTITKLLTLLMGTITLILCGIIPVNGQDIQTTNNTGYYYLEVYEISVVGTKSVNVNFGLNAPFGKTYKLMDEDGNYPDFANVIAALNYLGNHGWELVTVYDMELKSAGKRDYYVLRRSRNLPPTAQTKAIDEVMANLQTTK